MVHHVVPLDRGLVTRRQHLARGEEFCDAEHLLKSTRVVVQRRQQIFYDPVVPTRGQIDVLHVVRHLTIQNCADKKSNGFIKASLVILHLDDAALLREVVLDHLSPGSFVAACEDILKFQDVLYQVQFSLVAAWQKSGRVFS